MAVGAARGENAAREEKALREMTNRLVDDYGEAHPPERVEAVVGAVRKRFEGHAVRDFVPILVERIARRELDPKRSKNSAGQVDSSKSEPVAANGESDSPDGHGADTTSVFAAVAGRFVPARLVENKRVLGVAAAGVAAVTALGVILAVQQSDSPSDGGTAAPALTTVRGVVGSEKSAFFDDPKVVDALGKHGLEVDVEPAGSRQIATSVDLGKYDFAFPSSSAAAERIQRQRGVSGKYVPFSSPMAIATFKPIADLLTQAGIVQTGATTTFDVEKYLSLAEKGVQWTQLDGNTAYSVPKNVLVSTTDPRTSNSAAMYLAVTAYVANDNTIVRGAKAEDYAVSRVSRLFTRQGYTESSSDGPFKDYLANGMGTVPMAWIYEAQYVDAAVHNQLKPDMVLMYPKPTVMSQHTVVPFNDKGDRLGKLLTTDPDLQRLAADHGFRPTDVSLFTKATAAHQVPVDPNLVNQVGPPDYDTLEHLLDGVAKSYN
ncbi:three-helix bundle dimerization domain-containing protein [Nocardia sp. NPDC059764]|uniref:three-helix bundle dimerization domain-containing protein n=1 Tax=Nocardia sp. NPDC059764 TaxID=3346939 RepID=UPI00364972DF